MRRRQGDFKCRLKRTKKQKDNASRAENPWVSPVRGKGNEEHYGSSLNGGYEVGRGFKNKRRNFSLPILDVIAIIIVGNRVPWLIRIIRFQYVVERDDGQLNTEVIVQGIVVPGYSYVNLDQARYSPL